MKQQRYVKTKPRPLLRQWDMKSLATDLFRVKTQKADLKTNVKQSA